MDFISPPCRADGAPSNPCYSRVWDQIAEGKYVLTGAWSGWKIQATGKLVGPGGVKFSPWHLSMLWALRRDTLAPIVRGNDAANDDATEPAQAMLPGL